MKCDECGSKNVTRIGKEESDAGYTKCDECGNVFNTWMIV